MMSAAVADRSAFDRWFGCRMTEPKDPTLIEPAGRRIPARLALNPGSRLAWRQSGGMLLVFADGACIDTPASPALLQLVQRLATPGCVVSVSRFRSAAARRLIDALLGQGTLLPHK
jgi:hypothetical protein